MSILSRYPKLSALLNRSMNRLLHLREHLRLRSILIRLKPFAEHPLDQTWAFAKGFAMWLWRGICLVGAYIRDGYRNHRDRLFLAGTISVVVFAVLVGIYCGLAIYVEGKLVPVPAPDKTVYLGQGWGQGPTSDDRDAFYYMPQGALIKDIRYEWLTNIERPWKTDRFASPDYMRGYGFIVDTADSSKNPGGLPVGIAPRYSPKLNEMMLDLTCAGCHTGELQTTVNGVRTAVRIDGGSAHHDLTTNKAGRFAGDLAVSLFNTTLNPLKFRRFAIGVLKDQYSWRRGFALWREVTGTLWDDTKQYLRERPYYPMEEGFGRTDGLGRIGNSTFAVSLDYGNYRVANAPVSYPVIWEMTLLDWVQYTASVKQPMARNIGEAMGTGAKYYLLNQYGQPLPASERYDSSTQVANLQKIEDLVRKLKAPCWPEDVFGKIDPDKAALGKTLFYGKFDCVGCHGPHTAPDFVTLSEAPYKLAMENPESGGKNIPHWTVKALPALDIGTDPTSALNFYQYRVDLSKTGMKAEEVRTELTPYNTTQYLRQLEYFQNLVTVLTPNNSFMNPPPVADYVMMGAAPLDDASRDFLMKRGQFAWVTCNEKAPAPDMPLTGSRPVALQPLTEEQMKYFWPAPTLKGACASLTHLANEGLDGYLSEKLGDIQLTKVNQGVGLNYLITLLRDRAYKDMGIDGKNRPVMRALADGYAQLDLPNVVPQYMARPLAGMWASPPFLHNGSVPSLYEMLIPAYQRTKKFYVKGTQFDPRTVGLATDAAEKGAFLYDTTIQGNYNTGHEFRAGYRKWEEGGPPSYGVIGPEMGDDERWAVIEYLKIRRDYDDQACPESDVLDRQTKAANQSAKSAAKTIPAAVAK